ncbi:heavy metal translocating P-type ATPase [Geobacter sp. SVR]|uniref:heavy metal translocating P-type ATPase n=1 Tax=Geobacter sp. SVR TaxID=2495594 RepID=UPI00143EF605|nr:heavy metal translocating P-type ATPase [Geobacter sp. SVR]BCS53189.1 ATPase P [Geobacter sp. SVR]GCF84574.1 ATPase P [Geobacter sp. SVR]
MEYRILHETRDRLRLGLAVPRRPAVDGARMEAVFHGIAGLHRVSFSPRTGTILLRHDGRASTREALLSLASSASCPGSRRPRPLTELEHKKKVVVRSGSLLLLRPLIPPVLRPALALYGALPIFRKGMAALGRRELNVDVLDASAISAAMATRDLLTASVISFLLKLGEYLEEWARGHSRRLLAEMLHCEDEWAWVVRDGEEVCVPVEDVRTGETVVVRMGAQIPVDGRVLEGEALVNQSSLTGESMPLFRCAGSTVYAGTAVEEGLLRIRAEQIGSATRVARMVGIIEQGEALKAECQSKSEQMADKVVPWSFLLSGLTFAATGSPARAAAVLLVDYSCAIKLSTPLAILASLARAVRSGVLIKGGKFLERLAEADAFVLDKTGTLTDAAPQVAEVVAFNGFERQFVLRQAACVEEHFPHPVATAVVHRAADEGLIHSEEHAEVEYVLAHGIVSRLHGTRILVGSRHFVHEDEGVDVTVAEPHVAAFAGQGYSVLYVAMAGKLAGLIAIHDPLRAEASTFLALLRKEGIEKIVMLTGDSEATAAAIAGRLGIEEFHAQALPDRKVEIVRDLQRQGYIVAMVGDGINDSPALSHADVGISLKHGADIAREACDVLLVEGNLTNLLEARTVAREGMELVHSNYRTIIAVNSLALAMAITGIMPPVLSAAMHNASTIGVGLKALKPLRRRAQ